VDESFVVGVDESFVVDVDESFVVDVDESFVVNVDMDLDETKQNFLSRRKSGNVVFRTKKSYVAKKFGCGYLA
jgi:hypothetical protein